MMLVRLLISLFLFVSILDSCLIAQESDDSEIGVLKKKSSKKGIKQDKKKKSTEIDLEALDIQGLIDRPQTLYILKKSKIDFYDTIDENDYVKSIVESTYKPPF